MLSKLTEPPAHGQPRLQSKLCQQTNKINNNTHNNNNINAVWGLHGYLTLLF